MIVTRIFKYLQKKKIKSAINVRKNSIVSLKNNNRLRNKEVSSCIKDLFKWKKKRKYGHRWMVKETAFPLSRECLANIPLQLGFKTR